MIRSSNAQRGMSILDKREEKNMLNRYRENPIIAPGDVKPSADGFIVLGAFNPGAVCYKDEVILLLRVAEACQQSEGKFRVPSYNFKEGK